MEYARYRVSLRDQENAEVDTMEVYAPRDPQQVIACIREAIAKDGRYYVDEESGVEQAQADPKVDYYATVQHLRSFEGFCPACGDESSDTMESARVAYSLNRSGRCARCGTLFVIADSS